MTKNIKVEKVLVSDAPIDYPATTEGGCATIVNMTSWSKKAPRGLSAFVQTPAYNTAVAKRRVRVMAIIVGKTIAMNKSTHSCPGVYSCTSIPPSQRLAGHSNSEKITDEDLRELARSHQSFSPKGKVLILTRDAFHRAETKWEKMPCWRPLSQAGVANFTNAFSPAAAAVSGGDGVYGQPARDFQWMVISAFVEDTCR